MGPVVSLLRYTTLLASVLVLPSARCIQHSKHNGCEGYVYPVLALCVSLSNICTKLSCLRMYIVYIDFQKSINCNEQVQQQRLENFSVSVYIYIYV